MENSVLRVRVEKAPGGAIDQKQQGSSYWFLPIRRLTTLRDHRYK